MSSAVVINHHDIIDDGSVRYLTQILDYTQGSALKSVKPGRACSTRRVSGEDTITDPTHALATRYPGLCGSCRLS
eukprot:g46334.t1